MARFHINPSTGNPGPCKAMNGRCPFGGEENHYGSAAHAREAFEAQMTGNTIPRVSIADLGAPPVTLEEKVQAVMKKGLPDLEASRAADKADLAAWEGDFNHAVRVSAALSESAKAPAMEEYYGAGSYEATISKAADRASYASKFMKENKKKSNKGLDLSRYATAAPATVTQNTRSALAAGGSADFSRVGSFTSPSSKPASIQDALAARGGSSGRSLVGASASSFKF